MPGLKDVGQDGANKGTTVQLIVADFDEAYTLDEFPEDFECPLCMMVREDVVECPKCFQSSCRDCNVEFT